MNPDLIVLFTGEIIIILALYSIFVKRLGNTEMGRKD